MLSIFEMLGGMNGILLWPAAVWHALMGAAMLRVILAPSPESAVTSCMEWSHQDRHGFERQIVLVA